MQWAPQILHCNDWHTGFGPLFLKAAYDGDASFGSTRSLLTIHNIGYQGTFSAASIGDLGLGPKNYLLHQDDLRAGWINPLRHGILYADAITTVSPTHAREICTDQYGMGLQDSLRARGDALLPSQRKEEHHGVAAAADGALGAGARAGERRRSIGGVEGEDAREHGRRVARGSA